MKFRQSAAGSFQCDVIPGTNHCGIDAKQGNFQYKVEITYTDKRALDSQGFLLDNLAFSAYFNSLGVLRVSCEEVADGACAYFTELLGPRLRYVSDINVCIYPFEGVCIEAMHTPNNEVAL